MLKKKGFTIAGAELKFFPTGGLDERLSSAHLLELYSPDRLEPQWKREAAKKGGIDVFAASHLCMVISGGTASRSKRPPPWEISKHFLKSPHLPKRYPLPCQQSCRRQG